MGSRFSSPGRGCGEALWLITISLERRGEGGGWSPLTEYKGEGTFSRARG